MNNDVSQIMQQEPHFFGSIDTCINDDDPQINVYFNQSEDDLPPERQINDNLVPFMHTPQCTWQTARHQGKLSLLSFIAIWNDGIQDVSGFQIIPKIESTPYLGYPFLVWHPSGHYQAVRFDRTRELFTRRVLYAVSLPGVTETIAAHSGA